MTKHTWMKRLLALACAGAFALCFAACGNTEKEPESTAPDTTPVSDTAPETEAPQPSESDTQSNPAGPVVPQTKDEILALYTNALKQSNLKRTSEKRALNQGKIVAKIGSVDLTDPDWRPIFESTEDSSGWPMPAALSAGTVTSATIKTEGAARILTFKLADQSGSQDLKQGAGGHIGFVDHEAGMKMINTATGKLGVTVDINSLVFSLNQGTLTVTLDATQDIVKKISYSCNEDIAAKIKFSVFNIDANINYSISAEYAG